jgi:RNAse (barnase) inhibitor barstar
MHLMQLILNGGSIADIPSFYAEINRVFMTGETWELGESLDALNDMLFGGYGVLLGANHATILWQDMAFSRASLGVETTLQFLEERLAIRQNFNGQTIVRQLEALRAGTGKTYFDIVMEVFADHPSIEIVSA